MWSQMNQIWLRDLKKYMRQASSHECEFMHTHTHTLPFPFLVIVQHAKHA